MRAGFAGALGLALFAAVGNARAEHRVDFRADRVEISPEPGELALSGAVVVRLARFRLTSEAVRLSRSRRGVHVDGKGELGLCPCEAPPLTFGFRSADLAPPTDVLMQSATLRVGGVPVFWSPYLWLRAPERAGLLPPSLAYRGEEGLLVGSGAHLPLASEGRPHGLDFGASAYLRGGARLNLILDTSGGRTAAELDYFRGAALDVVSSYSTLGDRGQVFAERLDLLRGERAELAPATLSRLALPSDRLRVAVGGAQSSVFGLGVSADSARAGELTELGVLGPAFVLGSGGALGRRARYAISVNGRSAHSAPGDLFSGQAEAALSSSAALGPLLFEAALRERAEALTLADAHAFDVRSELRVRTGLPLLRRYTTLSHTLSPFGEAALLVGSREEVLATLLSDLEPPQRRLFALAGLETALGSNTDRTAADVKIVGGVETSARDATGVLAARARLDAGIGRVAAELRSLPANAAAETALRAELGQPGHLQFGIRVDGAAGDTRLARGVFRDDFVGPAALLFDRSGWGVGGRLLVPWGRSISTEVGSDVDISEKRWLSSSAAAAYRHPCRCLSVALFGSRRLGRRGFDLGVNLELVPR
ncbi:MAG TPA: hypothetical protein VG937_20570 [Polyangiaceae bacterium]|nr:hypothetical protein [Polyangiaceae bacterium]